MRAAFLAQQAQLEYQLAAAGLLQRLRDIERCFQAIPHLHFQCGTTERQGVIETRFNLHVEPAVDTAIDELHGKIKHDEQWQQGEADEHANHACFQARTRHMLAIIANQPRQVEYQYDRQQNDADGVDRKNDEMQPVEVFAVLRRLSKKKQCEQGEPQPDDDGGPIETSF